jgi:hypothetical protein
MSSQSTGDMVLQRKVAKLETARKIERVERMVRELQATVEKKDLEQKMERIQAQATLEKKDLEQKMERIQAQVQAVLEKKDLEQKMERMQVQAQAALEKKDLEQKMERMQAQAALEKKDLDLKKDLDQQMTNMELRHQLKQEQKDRKVQHQLQELQRLIESQHMHSNVQQRPLALQSSATDNMQQRARQAEMDAAAATTQAQLTRREADRQKENEEQMIRARAEGAALTKTLTSPPVEPMGILRRTFFYKIAGRQAARAAPRARAGGPGPAQRALTKISSPGTYLETGFLGLRVRL